MNSLKGRKVLITGGGLGFIGSNLALKLVAMGAKVEIYDALLQNLGGNLFNIDPVKRDVKVTIANINDSKNRNFELPDFIPSNVARFDGPRTELYN